MSRGNEKLPPLLGDRSMLMWSDTTSPISKGHRVQLFPFSPQVNSVQMGDKSCVPRGLEASGHAWCNVSAQSAHLPARRAHPLPHLWSWADDQQDNTKIQQAPQKTPLASISALPPVANLAESHPGMAKTPLCPLWIKGINKAKESHFIFNVRKHQNGESTALLRGEGP